MMKTVSHRLAFATTRRRALPRIRAQASEFIYCFSEKRRSYHAAGRASASAPMKTSSLIQAEKLQLLPGKRLMSSTAEIPDIKLYQYQICPFCNYTKAVLSYADVLSKTELIEVNPLNKVELKWSKDYKKVPVATLEGDQVNGSDVIVSSLLEKSYVKDSLKNKWGEESMSMEGFKESDSAKRWTAFATEDLAPLLYPNLCNTMGNSYRAFDYVNKVESFSTVQRIMIQSIGSIAMYFAASKIKKKRNISDVRQALMEALDVLETEGLNDGERQYLSDGSVPNLGDVAVFGTLKGLEGLEVHEEVIGSRVASDGEPSPLTQWYERMDEVVYGQKR